ncbi:putative transposase [Clostridium algifaecis]|uniref:Transposase n=1 Tax=Clostridium algifaecis TaxID=1472040 RepID=A0ABS4KRZ2_9CLOT|nr:IS66 family insertion sequence element accessory protein TnpB [Clostridium algifaecis]MBP2032803.1 putative transposase [Clostridium algifaecis]
MDKITHKMRLDYWMPIISKCHKSGMSVRAWCIQNNINEKKFYYWQRRIRGEAFKTLKRNESENQANFVQLPIHNNTLKSIPSFKPDIIIHIQDNVLEISNTVSEELLSKVLKVISDVK